MKALHMNKLGPALALMAVAALAGCGGSAQTDAKQGTAPEQKTETAKPPEPVKVTMYNHFNNISDDRLQQFIIGPLKQKLPHVTFEVVKHDKGTTIEELVAAKSFTDFYYGSNVGFPTYMNLQLQQDMNDVIKKNGLDLSRFDAPYVDAIKSFGEKGEMYGVPFSANMGVMLYNKAIFDKFAVPYPKDGMTWDEVIELGKKVTRPDGGVNYIGFDPGPISNVASSLSLPYADVKTGKALINNNESWRKIYDMFKAAYEIPGFVNAGKYDYGANGFFKDKNVAMLPVWALQVVNNKAELAKMEWDMVSLPNFKEQLGKGRSVDIHMLAISNVSKNRDVGVEVLKVITSDEVQKMMSEFGTPSVLKNEDIKKAYGSKLPEFQGKNVQAIFKTKPVQPAITKYDGTVGFYVEAARKDIATGAMDVNTALRTVQEKSDAKLAELQGK
ncbi:ABC transporter substrate-binding protein [Paenibacillus ginsengarvi]|uniref:Extracellular solute-binding protein n=1 Tax=Paenibacillus ginsengarvi TaxID=400777 RepID=A0A3B0CFA5_9BACL|nr:extracellular solute-binding protein [Paenibacillus ginsengarvi]RKN84303.1 extracellular solute-binding protein [Paenibacillus ginsengarvi]